MATSSPDAEAATLSANQRIILVWIWQHVVRIHMNGSPQERNKLLSLGVPWVATVRATAARRATMSRALRRLQRRGLLVRRRASGRRRTSHVLLTAFGMQVARAVLGQRG